VFELFGRFMMLSEGSFQIMKVANIVTKGGARRSGPSSCREAGVLGRSPEASK
jgi:hypothetical protein